MNGMMNMGKMVMAGLAAAFAAQGLLAAERPLKRTRIALCEPLAQKVAVTEPVMPVDWFRAEAEKCGCTLRVLPYREVTDCAVLCTNNFDTLILPATAMPFECEDTAFRFLQQGGSVITRTVIPQTYRITADCRTEDEFIRKHGAHRFREHGYGWYAPFLVRQNPSPQGQRTLKAPVPLAAGAKALVGDLLPLALTTESYGALSYRLLNRWEQVQGFDSGYGDVANYALAADCAFDPYVDADGLGTDFCVYRYRNAKIFGATLVQIGNVGAKLLRGPKGGDVFRAMLTLLEAELPGDRGPEYGRLAVQVQRDWSEFCFTYFEAVGALRDAAAFACDNGGDWQDLVMKLNAVERRYTELFARRSGQKALLRADREPAKAKAAAEALVRDLAEASVDFKARTIEAMTTLKDARMPTRKPVRDRMGTVVSIASSVMPMSLGRARGDCFDVMRRIGSNVTSTHPLGTWFTEDPTVREKLKGFWRDFKFVYATCPAFAIGGDRFNPANGTVTKGRDLTLDEAAVRQKIETWTSDFAFLGTNRFYRIGTGDETGMSTCSWGETATRKFRAWLAKRYGDVALMNRASGLSCASFDELKPPLRQPKTQAEHAVWQLWRLFREEWLRDFHRIFTRIVKEVCPSLETFQIPSTGGYLSPVFCLNFYEILSDVDQSGIDGTFCGNDYEWQYADICPQGRFMTSEWGGLYQENPLQKLYGKLWQEMGAGSWGAEQHRWSYGHDGCNYADHLDVPTRYGAMLWAWLKDVRRYDPLLMDGARAEPEVTILYSHTSRLHDQNWGWAGEKIFSPHMYAVASYYGFFLEYGRSARVIDEMALLKNPLQKSAVLIVPQAKYLEPEVQRALLDYARQGGHLVLEGRVGAFDGFGRASDLIFRQTSILPFNGPEAKTAACGKGTVTFTAADRGLEKPADFPAATERLLRSFGLSERFAVSDPSRMLREWTYDGETYLILASNEGTPGTDWGVGEVEIAVRGDVELEDWLTGARPKTSREDGYTVFRTLAVNGARVFRIVSGRIAAADDAAARARKPRFAEKSAATAASDLKDVTLPFAGKIYDTTSLRCGDTVFAHTTVSSGYRPDDGESYLTMRAPGVESRRRIEPGKTCYFRSRTRVFRVICEQVFQMYPFFSVIKVDEVADVPPCAGATVTKSGSDIRMENDLVELVFDTLQGGGLKSMKLAAERAEQVVGGRAFAVVDAMPGPFRAHALRAETATDAKSATLVQTLTGASRGYSFAQRTALAADAAEIDFGFTVGNRDKSGKKFSFSYHPELSFGSAADGADVFQAPLADGSVRAVPWRGVSDAIRFRKPVGPWAALVDTDERLALVTSFDPTKVGEVYCWDAPTFCTFEPSSPTVELPVGEDYAFAFTWRFFRGLAGVDAAAGRWAAHLNAPTVWDQSHPFIATLEVATANRDLCGVSARAWLLSGKKQVSVADVGLLCGVSFDLPAAVSVSGDFAKLADGDYLVDVEVTAKDGTKLSFRRPLELAGGQLKRVSAFCTAKAKEIEALGADVPGDRVFDLKLALKELERAVVECRLDDAERISRTFPSVKAEPPEVQQ